DTHAMICPCQQRKKRTLHAYKNQPETRFSTQNQMLARKLRRKFGLGEAPLPLTVIPAKAGIQ
ncbi:MAG: hypothetical protein ACLPWS_01255, partial [Rhodomicrobium sp.]